MMIIVRARFRIDGVLTIVKSAFPFAIT